MNKATAKEKRNLLKIKAVEDIYYFSYCPILWAKKAKDKKEKINKGENDGIWHR